MKKIISTFLALTMLLSCFVVANASDISTDANSAAGLAFSEVVGEGFNADHFFITEIAPEAEKVPEDVNILTDAAKVKISNSSNDALKLYFAQYITTNKTIWMNAEYEVAANSSVTIDYTSLSWIFCDAPEDSGAAATATFGVALLNPDDLTADAKITLDVTVSNNESDVSVIEPVEYTFNGPVTLNDAALSGFAALLTKAKFGEDLTTDDVVNAVNTATENEVSDGTISTLKTALTTYDVDVKELAELLEEKVTVSSVTFDGLTIAMPYAALSSKVEDGKNYIPVVEQGSAVGYEKQNGEVLVALDISLSDGTNEINKPLIAQKVIIDLPSNFDATKSVKVKHDDSWLDNDAVTVENGKISFTVDHFSNFILVGSELQASEETRAKKATIKFTQVDPENNPNMFAISLVPETDKQIINYATGGYTVNVKATDNSATEELPLKDFAYELTPAEGIIITPDNYDIEPTSAFIGGFSFVASAKEGALITKGINEELVLATLEVKGTGDFTLYGQGLGENGDNEQDRKNMFYMEKMTDNDSTKAYIVPDYTNFTVPTKKYSVSLNVDFALELNDENATYANDADYIDIVITIKNNVTGEDYKVAVGENSTNPEIDKCIPVTYMSEKAIASNESVAETDKIMLPAGVTYSLVIEGKGFRTYRDYFTLDEDVKINLWNNALTSEAREVINGETRSAKEVTFLVGDIYEDGIVDIYDLSAVTAYYNTKDIETGSKYVAYDLDRNGAIDVQDIAWVQMSYGN